MQALAIAQHRRLPTARVHASTAVGGWDSTYSVVSTVEAYDGSLWSTAASMPTARTYVGVGVLGANLYGVCSAQWEPAHTRLQ